MPCVGFDISACVGMRESGYRGKLPVLKVSCHIIYLDVLHVWSWPNR